MINRVGDSRTGTLKPPRADGGTPAVVRSGAGGPQAARAARPGSLVADIVAGGPPVDGAKVAAIKAAIAEGRYPVDPVRIAEGMIALGFGPGK